MENTYFELLPTEILYIIFNNLSSIQIIKSFYDSIFIEHRVYFEKLIKEDFGDGIRSDLIKDVNIKKYLVFSSNYKSLMVKYKDCKAAKKLQLDTRLLDPIKIMKICPELSDFCVNGTGKYVLMVYINRDSSRMMLYSYSEDKEHKSVYSSVSLETFKNLLFFFGKGSVFTF